MVLAVNWLSARSGLSRREARSRRARGNADVGRLSMAVDGYGFDDVHTRLRWWFVFITRDREGLSMRLKELRQQAGLTQTQVARSLGLHRSSYIHYELGERKPSFELLFKFADFYKVTTDYLLDYSDINYKTLETQNTQYVSK
ncbi:MAG: helix-turn-helix transcriptional regulator [Oscillospiraceae bacterium]|jgi:DNA-binding XRE family transcriptional regulator|nr:helix-turn-helix transcriptional regulator [Oscillospiraceae bacterium]